MRALTAEAIRVRVRVAPGLIALTDKTSRGRYQLTPLPSETVPVIGRSSTGVSTSSRVRDGGSQMLRRVTAVVAILGAFCLFSAAHVSAQGAGGIAGVVRDTSGAVLPGVTVEASSPSLIEKVRLVVTDAEGQYKIIDLRPGTYTVTFTLTGFSTVRREGIALSAGFTASVNIDLRVGGLEETITVSGQ